MYRVYGPLPFADVVIARSRGTTTTARVLLPAPVRLSHPDQPETVRFPFSKGALPESAPAVDPRLWRLLLPRLPPLPALHSWARNSRGEPGCYTPSPSPPA